MIAPFRLKITYDIACGIRGCESLITQSFVAYEGTQFQYPYTLSGWITLDGVKICPKHKITVDDTPWT